MSDLPQDPARERELETEPPSHLRSNIREAISGARCLVMDELVKELVLALELEGFRLDEFITALERQSSKRG